MSNTSKYFLYRISSVLAEQAQVLDTMPMMLTAVLGSLREIDGLEPSMAYKTGPSPFSRLFMLGQLASAVCASGGVDALGFIEYMDLCNSEIKKLKARYQGRPTPMLDIASSVLDEFIGGKEVSDRYKKALETLNAPRA